MTCCLTSNTSYLCSVLPREPVQAQDRGRSRERRFLWVRHPVCVVCVWLCFYACICLGQSWGNCQPFPGSAGLPGTSGQQAGRNDGRLESDTHMGGMQASLQLPSLRQRLTTATRAQQDGRKRPPPSKRFVTWSSCWRWKYKIDCFGKVEAGPGYGKYKETL